MTPKQIEKLERFRGLFDLVSPDKKMSQRIKDCANLGMLSASSVRVYLARSATHPPSERTLAILEKALKKRKNQAK
jgi:hypothetical protein